MCVLVFLSHICCLYFFFTVSVLLHDVVLNKTIFYLSAALTSSRYIQIHFLYYYRKRWDKVYLNIIARAVHTHTYTWHIYKIVIYRRRAQKIARLAVCVCVSGPVLNQILCRERSNSKLCVPNIFINVVRRTLAFWFGKISICTSNMFVYENCLPKVYI